jgi:uncharacterized damage-inducible protein DinB
MSLQHLMIDYARYNAWANETLINWLNAKPEEVLTQEVPSSFSSIIKTFNHILAVQEFWLAVIQEEPQVAPRYIAQTFDIDEIKTTLLAQSKAMAEYIAALSEDTLVAMVNLDAPWAKGTKPCYQFLQHVFNHSTYHRGQITTIGRNLGLTDAPMTDYNYYQLALQEVRV